MTNGGCRPRTPARGLRQSGRVASLLETRATTGPRDRCTREPVSWTGFVQGREVRGLAGAWIPSV